MALPQTLSIKNDIVHPRTVIISGKILFRAYGPPKIKPNSVSKRILFSTVNSEFCQTSEPSPTKISLNVKPTNTLKSESVISTKSIILPLSLKVLTLELDQPKNTYHARRVE